MFGQGNVPKWLVDKKQYEYKLFRPGKLYGNVLFWFAVTKMADVWIANSMSAVMDRRD